MDLLKQITGAGRWTSIAPNLVLVGFADRNAADDLMLMIATKTGKSLPWRVDDPNPGKPVLYLPENYFRLRKAFCR